ncbi:MAG: metallophosphoesterase [Oscillospiraceae bacterium]|jgi:predicted phosphohydrolase|nr:metallophosphoesterase [Oscillospiraceae bacterium]
MLYTIGDLHLSLTANKPMDVFGGAWEGYAAKVEKGLSALTEDDTLVLCGDTSWGMTLAEALADFTFLERYPCKKLLLKGNHDYFWDTASKMKRFFAENSLRTLDILHNNAFPYGDAAICGTRGWFFEEERGGEHDVKMINREVGRLRASLDAGRKLTGDELLVFLHYPPLYKGYRCDQLVDVLNEYGVKRCYFGHLHGYARSRAIEGSYGGIHYRLISADHLDFTPVPVELP